ncbi:fatty acid cis/trans isomerase [Vibrio lentus]|nr:fatty acid cis/trans isomerase [Vibrio lentus]
MLTLRSPFSDTSDSASVVQGLVGPQPKTAWILDYALLERIFTICLWQVLTFTAILATS